MEYRKNPITGEWVIINNDHCQAPRQQSDVYETAELTHGGIKANDGFSVDFLSLTKDGLLKLFNHYIHWANSTKTACPDIFIHNILKEHCLPTENPLTSTMYLSPKGNKFIGENIKKADIFFKKHSKCVICSMIEYEQETNIRIVGKNNHFLVFECFASILPYETIIAPIKHKPDFLSITEDELIALSSICYDLFHSIANNLDGVDFSININNILTPDEYKLSAHWHIQVIPWVTHWAGFEIGASTHINITTPESCAERLKINRQFNSNQ